MNALQRPICAASNVIRAGIRNFRVPSLIDLPETSAFSSISGRFWVVPRFVRNNPFGDLRIYASGFGGTFNIRSNPDLRSAAFAFDCRNSAGAGHQIGASGINLCGLATVPVIHNRSRAASRVHDIWRRLIGFAGRRDLRLG